MILLRQSTSVDVPLGPFLDETDGKTAETALSITQPDIRVKKNGAAWAQKNAAQTLSHEENGYYEATLDATDTDTLGRMKVAVHKSGALPVWENFMVIPANVYDSLIGGSDTLDVQVTGIGAGAVTASAIATNAITASGLAADAANEIADAFLDRADAIETGLTPRGALRLSASEAAGDVAGADTGTVTIKNFGNTKVRINANGDASGNRTVTGTDVT